MDCHLLSLLFFNVLQLENEMKDHNWGVLDEESGNQRHLSLSLDSTFHHCCLQKEADVELVHRDLSTALLLQLIHQKGFLDKRHKEVVKEDAIEIMVLQETSTGSPVKDNTGNTKEAKLNDKWEIEARKLGKVLWQLQASLKCNTHGVGERVVQEHEDGQACWSLKKFHVLFMILHFGMFH